LKKTFDVPTVFDYSQLELKVGFEIHQQLDTSHKLFCSCRADVEKIELGGAEPVRRFLRATRSELGEVDVAAAFESRRKREFDYVSKWDSACLVELDEEPPHQLNREAIVTAVAIAKALRSSIVDEVHVMRKIVVDGSNTTGFQRTALVALGGVVEDEEGDVRIEAIFVEEDAARKIEEKGQSVVYALDRLGIPLIEISTEPDIRTPQQALRVAEKIGLLLRLTGRVKRGLGTIRQDINLSIRGTPKIEIKGVQRLELIPKVIENEVRRLVGLLMIRDELVRRNVDVKLIEEQTPVDVTEVLAKCSSKLVESNVRKGARVYALRLPGFGGLLGVELQPNRRFGTEVADYVKQWTGVGGIIHSDELPAYGIEGACLEELMNVLSVGEHDAFVLVVAPREKALEALNIVKMRAVAALQGVPKETRAAAEDGTTRYMRPQPGSARMYPETDVPPILVTRELLEEADKFVPPDPYELEKILVKRGLSPDLAKQIIRSEFYPLFAKLLDGCSLEPSLTASMFTTIRGELEKDGVDISTLSDEYFVKLCEEASRVGGGKDFIVEALKAAVLEGIVDPSEFSKKFLSKAVSADEIRRIVRKKIEENMDIVVRRGEKAFSLIMGKVMSELRGRADGKIVAAIVKEELGSVLKARR